MNSKQIITAAQLLLGLLCCGIVFVYFTRS